MNSEELVRELRRDLEGHRAEVLDLLMETVRIPTESPPGKNYPVVVDTLLPHLQRVGFRAERYDLPEAIFEERCRRYYPEMIGDRTNLLGRFEGPERPGIGFYCHLDTVPAGDPDNWGFDPFQPFVRDGYVWGRGSADSKGGAVAILAAFAALQRLGVEPAQPCVVALTTDEEIGPYTGLMHMADCGVFDGCDHFHSCDGMADSVGIGSLGAFTWTVRARGRSVHSGSSFLGVNPIERGLPLLEELISLKGEVEARQSALRVSPEVERATGRTNLASLLNVTIARAGVKHNVVPPDLVLEGDRRFIPEEEEEDCIAELKSALERAGKRDPELGLDLMTRPFYTSFAGDPENAWILRVRELVEKVRGGPMPLAGISGSTDVAHLARVTGMTVTVSGLARHGETRNHGAEERARISDILEAATVTAALAAGVA